MPLGMAQLSLLPGTPPLSYLYPIVLSPISSLSGKPHLPVVFLYFWSRFSKKQQQGETAAERDRRKSDG